MVEKDGLQIPAAAADLRCECEQVSFPRQVKDWPDDKLWDLIREECPNYFGKKGEPNGVATRLFDLFKADLLGLIADYAITPISDVYIELDTGDVLGQQSYIEQNGITPHVFLEVDILERALTQRAVLRATAAKILRQMGYQRVIKEELGGDIRLTDFERDTLLRMVYEPKEVAGIKYEPGTNWFGFLHIVRDQVTAFLKGIKDGGLSFEEREKEQLTDASKLLSTSSPSRRLMCLKMNLRP